MGDSGTGTRSRAKGQRGKGIEEVVSYSMGHRIRITVLTLLNERVYCIEELAELIGDPTTTVAYHVNELAEAGAIEVAYTKPVRNTTCHYFRAVMQPVVSDEEARAMPLKQRQVIAGTTLQCMMAESMDALWAGHLASEPERVVLSWRWFNVDRRAEEEIHKELADSWARIQEIEAQSMGRVESNEEQNSVIVAMQSFPRSRTTMYPPAPLVNPE